MESSFGKVIQWGIALLIIASCVVLAGTDDHKTGFPPVARIRIIIPEDQSSLLLGTLRQFAAAEHLMVTEGSFQKLQNPVSQMLLEQPGTTTSFYLSNFRKLDEYELTAYSHENRTQWQATWTRLMTRLQNVFGTDHVRDDFEDLKKPAGK